MPSSHTLDQLDICFDDTHAIASAGLLPPATLAERLGIQQTADQLINLGQRPGAAHPGAKLLTLTHSILAGGTASMTSTCCAAGPPARCWPPCPGASTIGTFLRALTFGHPPARPAHRADPRQGVDRRRRTRRRAHDHRRIQVKSQA